MTAPQSPWGTGRDAGQVVVAPLARDPLACSSAGNKIRDCYFNLLLF